MTPTQLRYETKAKIVRSIGEYIASHFTKRQILHWLLDGERFEDRPDITYRPDREIVKRKVVERDVFNKVVGSREDEYTYYPSGEVRDIVQREFDADGEEIHRRRIKHFRDRRQPIVIMER